MSRFSSARRCATQTASALAVLAFLATGCASGSSDSVAAPEVAVTREPVPRQIVEPSSTPLGLDPVESSSSSSSTTTTTTTTTSAAPLVADSTISVMGSIRTVPTGTTSSLSADEDGTVIATLGCTGSTGCGPGDIAAWAANTVDIVNLATTAAALDGATALNEQSAALVASGVATIGFGTNTAEALTPALIGSTNAPVAIYAINLDEDLAPSLIATDTSPGVLGGLDGLALLLERVAESLDAGQEVIVLADFDRSDDRSPQAYALEQTQALVDAGVDVVVGHGSDFLQRFERLGDTAVAFNLGNAATTTEEPLRRDTAVFRFERTLAGSVTCLLPATGGPDGLTIDNPDTALSCE